MTQWEYRILLLSSLDIRQSEEEALNNLGQEGWELISVNLSGAAYFKRPKPYEPARRARSGTR